MNNKLKNNSIIILFIVVFLTFNAAKSQILLKGGVSTVFEKGKEIEISLVTPINFYFSAEGDEIRAYISKDILYEGKLLFSKGSLIQGEIKKINSPKRFGINGSFEFEFSEVTTPQGKSIPIYASAETGKGDFSEQLGNILTYDSALLSYGALNGGIAAIQYGGLPLAISSHGISVLAGAGVGASAGLIGSVRRKGQLPIGYRGISTPIMLKSGLYILGNIDDLELSSSQEIKKEGEYKGFRYFPTLKKEQIVVEIKSIQKKHSKVYGNYLLIEIKIQNKSGGAVSFTDFLLVSKKELDPIHPDLFLAGADILKTIKSNEEYNAKLAYLIRSKKLEDYSLVLIDPMDRKEIVSLPLKGKE